MFEGPRNGAGPVIVVTAFVALIAFTGLLYIRGASAPRPIPVAGNPATPRPQASPTRSPLPSGAAAAASPTRSSSARPAGTGSVAGATSTAGTASASDPPSPSPTPTPTRTPRPTPKPTPTPKITEAPSGYRLPSSPQSATVALDNGQGDCPNFPTSAVADSSFSQSSGGRLTAVSPTGQRLSGRVQANGSFSLSGDNPEEKWVGTLTRTGGRGTYSVVSNGCTEGYETMIAFT